MKKIDIVGIAFSNFRRRKTRSILTVLGVVIGVASIVVMVSLGIAVNVYFDKQTEMIGDLTTVNVRPGYDNTTGEQKGSLNDEIIAQLEALEGVVAVSPEIQLWGKLASGKYVTYVNIRGVRSALLDKIGVDEPDVGTTAGLAETSKKNIRMILGSEIAYQFYNPRSRGNSGGMMGGMSMSFGGGDSEEERPPPEVDVMGENAKLKFTFDSNYGERKQPGSSQPAQRTILYPVEALGVLKQNYSNDYNAYIDIELAKELKKEQEKQQNSGGSGGQQKKKKELTYDSISVIANTLDETVALTELIKEDLGLEAYTNAEYINNTKQLAGVLQMILGGIGSISLLVAAIGITNTMIMSIYERTKEIGIMKVIGCQLKDIRTMFLCEAGFIGLFGGAVGLIISYSVSFLLNLIGKGGGEGGGVLGGLLGGGGGGEVALSVIPPWLAAAAVIFAIMVGLISGFLPARRAMRLSALEAMRN